MTSINTYKKQGCMNITGESGPTSLNDVERAAYKTHLGETNNDSSINRLAKDFYQSLTPTTYEGAYNDVVKNSVQDYLGSTEENFNDLMYAFWKDVAENGLGTEGKVLAFNGTIGSLLNGITLNSRYNITTGTQAVDGWSVDVKVPVGVEGPWSIITDVAGNRSNAVVTTVGGVTRITVSDVTVLDINIADGEWHHLDFHKNSTNFSYAIFLDGRKFTPSSSQTTSRYCQALGKGAGSNSSPYGGIQFRNFQFINAKVPRVELLLDEEDGSVANNTYGTPLTIEGDFSWEAGATPDWQPTFLSSSAGNDFNYLYSTQPIYLVGGGSQVGDYLEFEYKCETSSTYNNLLTPEGFRTSGDNSVLYFEAASPTVLRFRNASGNVRSITLGFNLDDGVWRKFKLQAEGGTAIRLFVNDVDEGLFSGMSLEPIHAFSGRNGVYTSRSVGMGFRNITYVAGGVTVIDAQCNDGAGRLLTNNGTGDDLILAQGDYMWSTAPVIP